MKREEHRKGELVVFSFRENPLPDRGGFIKLLLPEGHFFCLVRFNNEKTFWQGIFRNRNLLKEKETASVRNEKEGSIRVVAVTRCLIFTTTPSLRFAFNEFATNPCVRACLKATEELVVNYTVSMDESLFIKEFWSFTSKTGGFCPPATCGSDDCHRFGGISAPVFIGKRAIC